MRVRETVMPAKRESRPSVSVDEDHRSAGTPLSRGDGRRDATDLPPSDHRARRLAVPRIASAVAVSSRVSSACWWSLPFWLRRRCSSSSSSAIRRARCPRPQAVLSPADGRIVEVGKARDPVPRPRRAQDQRVHERVQRALQPQPGRRHGEQALVPRRQLRQRRARQGVARERAQRAAPAHAPPAATSPACRSRG